MSINEQRNELSSFLLSCKNFLIFIYLFSIFILAREKNLLYLEHVVSGEFIDKW